MDEVLSRLVNEASQSLDVLSSLWDEIGHDMEQRSHLCRELENELKRVLTAKIQDAQETKAQIQLRIRLSGVRIKSLRSQLDLSRDDISESEDVEANSHPRMPLRNILGHLESTLSVLDECKVSRLASLNSKSERLITLIKSIGGDINEESSQLIHIDPEDSLSSQREVDLDKRLAEIESIKADRIAIIKSLCERMGKIWESLGVDFLGSDTDMLDAQVANVELKCNMIELLFFNSYINVQIRSGGHGLPCNTETVSQLQEREVLLGEDCSCQITFSLIFHFLCVALNCAQRTYLKLFSLCVW
jgi:hypothetical protein